MLRRLAALFVLFVSLSVVLPAAAACMSVMHGDCCPPQQPCDMGESPVVTLSIAVPCCLVQPAPTSSTVDVSSRSERRFDDSPVPDHSAAPIFALPVLRSLSIEQTAGAAAPSIVIDQQHTWLRTGRLRL